MAAPEEPLPVKYVIAALYRDVEWFSSVMEILVDRWGEVDFIGDDHLFDVTAYYEPEMGVPLTRKLLAFKMLYSPTLLVEMKLGCNAMEEKFAIGGKRRVNLDAGYLDHNKFLLASAKEAGQKVYLDLGIYADLSGRYKAGRYQPFEWTFPDFRDGRYDKELIAIRKMYMQQLRVYRQKT